MVTSILSWVLIGLIAGGLARAIMPGHQGGGIIKTILLGIFGALVGGFLGGLFFGVSSGLSIGGIAVAVAGACLLVFLGEKLG